MENQTPSKKVEIIPPVIKIPSVPEKVLKELKKSGLSYPKRPEDNNTWTRQILDRFTQ